MFDSNSEEGSSSFKRKKWLAKRFLKRNKEHIESYFKLNVENIFLILLAIITLYILIFF